MRGIGAGILAAILTMALAFGNGTVPAIADENAPAPTTHNAIVLVLDNSGSMSGEPIERLKTATRQFVDKVLTKDPEGKIALVAFSDDTNVQDFTSDKNALDSFADNNLWGDSGTDVTAGLKKADELYSGLKDTDTVHYKRSIVTMSDGWPNDADSSLQQAAPMLNKYDMYSVGFYTSPDDMAKAFMQLIQNKGYYEANDLNQLISKFVTIADAILNPLTLKLSTTKWTQIYPTKRDTYVIKAVISNPNNHNVSHVKATLSLDSNLTFTGNRTYDLETIDANTTVSVAWENILPVNQQTITNSIYTVTITGDNIADLSQSGRIYFNTTTQTDNRLLFGTDNWAFKNFTDWKLSHNDRNALLDNASLFRYYDKATGKVTNRNATRAEIEDQIDEYSNTNSSPGNGNCYGLATSAILAKMKIDNPYNRVTPAATDLHHVPKNDKVISYINYYHLGQLLDPIRDGYDKFSRLDKSSRLLKLRDMSQQTMSGGSPTLLVFAHHIVIADSYTPVTNSNQFTGKIHIVDSNNPTDSNLYMYINTNTSYWNYDDGNGITYSDNNDQIQFATNDLSLIGMKDNKIETANEAARFKAQRRTSYYRATLAVGSITMPIADILNNRYPTFTHFYDSDGNKKDTPLNIVLPDKKQYSISSPDNYDYSINYANAYTSVQSPKAKSAAFSPDGTVALTGNEGQYTLGSAVDANPMPWYHVKVSGKAAKDVKLVKDADGYIVEGDNLTDAKVSANNTSETKTVKLNTKADKVQMRADGNKLVAAIDKDHNGSYETVIADSANQDNHGTPSAPQGSNGKPTNKPLSDTGSAVTAFAITGGALLLAGVTVILIARRRRG